MGGWGSKTALLISWQCKSKITIFKFCSIGIQELPYQYTKTPDKGDFLIFKGWVDQLQTECIVIFISDWGQEILKTQKTWLMDGTFRSVPERFAQIYMCILQLLKPGGQHIAASETRGTEHTSGISPAP